MADQKQRMVSDLALFGGCRPAELRGIAKIGDVVDIPEGRVLARQGSHAKEFAIVVEGHAVATNGRGEVVLGAGSHYGALEIIDGRPHARTIRAGKGLQLLAFESRAFYGLLQIPAIDRKLLAELASSVPAGGQYNGLRAAS